MLKNLDFLLIGIILFIFGFYSAVFVELVMPFNFSETITIVVNPLSILSIIATVLLAFYITRVLTQQNEKDNQEKRLLIEYFKDFKIQLDVKTNKILDQNKFNSSLNVSEFKFLRAKLYSSIELAKHQNFVNKEISVELHKTLTNIWELLTDESHYEEQGLKQEHKSSVCSQLIKIDELIFKIIVEINKAKR